MKYNRFVKVKKYPQSHLVITSDSGKKLIIDPGYLTYEKGFKVEDFKGADVYLITHQHSDHLDPETIKEVVGDSPVYGNSDVAAKLKEFGVEANEVRDRQTFEAAGFKITPYDLPHFPNHLGKEVPPNTGFVIDGILFHAGDGYELDGLNIDNVALPIAHPSISSVQVFQFAKSLKVKLIIPIHYDVYLRDPSEIANLVKDLNIEVRSLKWGEETEI